MCFSFFDSETFYSKVSFSNNDNIHFFEIYNRDIEIIDCSLKYNRNNYWLENLELYNFFYGVDFELPDGNRKFGIIDEYFNIDIRNDKIYFILKDDSKIIYIGNLSWKMLDYKKYIENE